jgi:predicted nucleotidyltransferase
LILRPLEILRVLREHGVDFLVIGGIAVSAHGYIRATKDVDIIPRPSSENFERLMEALAALDAEADIGNFPPEETPVELTAEGFEFGGNWALTTRLGRLDLMQTVTRARSYEQLWSAAVVKDGIAYVGLDDLIAMKQAAGRDLDYVDIRALEEARGAGS